MASLNDLKLSYRAFLRTYPWRRAVSSAPARLDRPLARCRVALVSSAGMTAADDPPFDASIRGGDPSFRWIAREVRLESLVENQRSDAFDRAGIDEDRNLALPLDRLRELENAGEVGEVAPRHVSLMGSLSAPGRMLRDAAPEIIAGLRRDEVDVALLVPV